MSEQKKISTEASRKISFFMFASISIVVLYHAGLCYHYPLIEQVGPASTACFFCVSAFFFYNGLTKENLGTRLKKRCKTLLLPYVLWNIIYIIIYGGWKQLSFKNVITWFTIGPLCVPSWFLLTLFIYMMLAVVVRRAYKRISTTILTVGIGILLSYLGYIRFQVEVAGIPFVGGYLVRMSEYLAPYLIGGAIGTWLTGKIAVGWKNCIAGLIGTCAALFLLLRDIPVELRWFLWIILPLLAWEAVPEKLFSKIGFITIFTEPIFFINMMHWFLLYIWGMATVGIAVPQYREALNVVLTYLSAYALYYMLKQFAPKVLAVLTGNRNQ